MKATFSLWLAVVLVAPLNGQVQSVENAPFLGGQSAVGRDLELDDGVAGRSVFEAWRTLGQTAEERFGFDFAIDYATLYQHGSGGAGDLDDAFGGVLRAYGKWRLLGRDTPDTGSLVWKYENRHQLGTKIAPGAMGRNLGYVGLTGTSFNDLGSFVAPLYWEQFLNDGKIGFVAGRLDPLDFVDISGYSSQWRRFQNASLLANSSIALPDLGFGASAGFIVDDQWVFGASVHDANGAPTEYKFFDEGSELFAQAYASWTPSRAQRFDQELHFTAWHSGRRDTAEVPEGWGLALSANWLIAEQWMPFMRAGWSDGGAARADAALIAGMLYRPDAINGELGLGWGWESLSNERLDKQQALELFFRWDVTPSIAITPSVQLLIEPAQNEDGDTAAVFGLRSRIVF